MTLSAPPQNEHGRASPASATAASNKVLNNTVVLICFGITFSLAGTPNRADAVLRDFPTIPVLSLSSLLFGEDQSERA
jgi:hypothetical protein